MLCEMMLTLSAMENALVEYNHIKTVVKIFYNLTSYNVTFSIYGEGVQDFF